MPVPSKMADLFTIAASNSPAGSDLIGNSLDDYLRAAFAILRSTNALASASIAAASTTDLSTADAESVQITGSATINSLGTVSPGIVRECRFTGACTLTNSTAIVLPGTSNIATSAGDIIRFRSLGSGNWVMVDALSSYGYLPLNGGTLTGALGGTSASFSLTVGATGFTVPTGQTQGIQALWNNIASGNGRNEYINNFGAGTGGHYFYSRSSTANGATLNGSLDASGNFVAAGNVSAQAGAVIGGNTVLTLQPLSNGQVFMRPGGQGVSTGQFSMTTTLATFTGNVETTSGAIHAVGGNSAFNGQGAYLGWNRGALGGETDLVNHKGSGSGGFALYNTDGTTYTLLSTLDSTGKWQAGDFVATSDARLKADIRPLRAGYAALKTCAPSEYDKYTPEGDFMQREAGFIAQKLREVLPTAVSEGKDGFLRVSDRQVLAMVARAVLDIGESMEARGLL